MTCARVARIFSTTFQSSGKWISQISGSVIVLEKRFPDIHNPASLTYATISEQKCYDSIRTRGWRGTETFNIKYQTSRILKLRTDLEKRGENIDTASKLVSHMTSFSLSLDHQLCAWIFSAAANHAYFVIFVEFLYPNYRTMCMLREKY